MPATQTPTEIIITPIYKTIYLNNNSRIIAEQVARGVYQHRLVAGEARWSCADLVGTARKYAARYSSSRDTLVGKMRAAGLHVTYVKGSNDKWIVIVSYDSVNISTSGPRAARVINVVLAA